MLAHGIGNWWMLYGFLCVLMFGFMTALAAFNALSSMLAFREAGRKAGREAALKQKLVVEEMVRGLQKALMVRCINGWKKQMAEGG